MKFSCERCGKKYATAEQPVPGRVYKLKCKACGHLIVVRGAAEGAAATGGAPVAVARSAAAAAAAGLPPGGEANAPAPKSTSGVPLAGTTELRLPLPSDPTQELVARTSSTVAIAESPAPPPVDALAPPPADSGYVDIFADSPDAARTAAPEGSPELAAAPEPTPPPADPFLAAARSSLPETFGGPSADPFAPMRAELEAAATGDVPRPDGASRPLATPKFPEIPRPPVQKQGLPIVLVGAGVLVIAVILGIALTSVGGKKSPAPAPQVAAAQPVANPAPAPELAPPPPVEPAATAPAPEPPEPAREPEPKPKAAPKPSKPARVERAAERQRRPERKPEPRPQQVAEAAAEAPPRKEPQVDLPVASEGLSQDQIQKVLASTRKAFDACIASAGKDSSRTLDGRKVALRLNIQPNGTVTYPTLDDVNLNATALGSCLKSAARLMVFPKFKGDPLRIEVPLTLSR